MIIAPRRVLVVGGSASGLAVAESMRREGFDGDVTVVSRELGAPYDRPPLSKKFLSGEWSADQLALGSLSSIEEHRIRWLAGHSATALDVTRRRVTLDNGAELVYDHVVIATGLRPRTYETLMPHGVAGIHTLRTIDDALALRAELDEARAAVVVGAGFIGTEVAATLAGLGHRVTLLDGLPHPLAGVMGAAVGEFLHALHSAGGVEVRSGVPVVGVAVEDRRVSGVRLGDGSFLPADVVIIALGSLPNTEWLEGSGLVLTDGVSADARLSAAPGVSVVGDVASFPVSMASGQVRVEHRFNATEQAMFVARTLVLGDGGPFRTVPYFWSDQHGRRLQGYGRPSASDDLRLVEGAIDEGKFLVAHGRNGVVVGVVGVDMPNQVRRAKKWIEQAMPWDDVPRTLAASISGPSLPA